MIEPSGRIWIVDEHLIPRIFGLSRTTINSGEERLSAMLGVTVSAPLLRAIGDVGVGDQRPGRSGSVDKLPDVDLGREMLNEGKG